MVGLFYFCRNRPSSRAKRGTERPIGSRIAADVPTPGHGKGDGARRQQVIAQR